MALGEDPFCFGRMHIFSRTIWASLEKKVLGILTPQRRSLGQGVGWQQNVVERSGRHRRALLAQMLWSLVSRVANSDVFVFPSLCLGRKAQ